MVFFQRVWIWSAWFISDFRGPELLGLHCDQSHPRSPKSSLPPRQWRPSVWQANSEDWGPAEWSQGSLDHRTDGNLRIRLSARAEPTQEVPRHLEELSHTISQQHLLSIYSTGKQQEQSSYCLSSWGTLQAACSTTKWNRFKRIEMMWNRLFYSNRFKLEISKKNNNRKIFRCIEAVQYRFKYSRDEGGSREWIFKNIYA